MLCSWAKECLESQLGYSEFTDGSQMHICVLGIKQQLLPHTKSILKSQIESKLNTFI